MEANKASIFLFEFSQIINYLNTKIINIKLNSMSKNVMNLQAFDINAARKGAKVVTRMGFPVRVISVNKENKVLAIIDHGGFFNRVVEKWNLDGSKFKGAEHYTDLFIVA